MDIRNRARLETNLRRAINRVFKQYATGSERMPAWGNVKADLVQEIYPILDQIQLNAIRTLYSEHGTGPAPSEAKPQALKQAEDLAKQLAANSISQWKQLGKKPSAELRDQWFNKTFGTDRATRIAITEVTRANQAGEDIAWKHLKKASVRLEGYWRAEPGMCAICRRMDGRTSKYWRKYFPAGPPSPHPNCRCHIEHVEL